MKEKAGENWCSRVSEKVGRTRIKGAGTGSLVENHPTCSQGEEIREDWQMTEKEGQGILQEEEQGRTKLFWNAKGDHPPSILTIVQSLTGSLIRPVRFGDQGLDELALGWGVPGLDQISKAPVGGAVIVTLSKEKGCFDYLLLIRFAAKSGVEQQ